MKDAACDVRPDSPYYQERRDIALFVRAARTSLGMSLDGMSAILHQSPDTISKWESGQSRPDIETLMRISSIAGRAIPTYLKAGETGEGDMRWHEPVSAKLIDEINDSLGTEIVEIRMDKDLFASIDLIAQFHGRNLHSLVRQSIESFANQEMASIIKGEVEARKITLKASSPRPTVT